MAGGSAARRMGAFLGRDGQQRDLKAWESQWDKAAEAVAYPWVMAIPCPPLSPHHSIPCLEHSCAWQVLIGAYKAAGLSSWC